VTEKAVNDSSFPQSLAYYLFPVDTVSSPVLKLYSKVQCSVWMDTVRNKEDGRDS
jgi:hypothetical protein